MNAGNIWKIILKYFFVECAESVASGKRNLRYRYHDNPPRCRQRYRGSVAPPATSLRGCSELPVSVPSSRGGALRSGLRLASVLAFCWWRRGLGGFGLGFALAPAALGRAAVVFGSFVIGVLVVCCPVSGFSVLFGVSVGSFLVAFRLFRVSLW